MRLGSKLMISLAAVGVVPILIALAAIQFSIRPSYEQIVLDGMRNTVDQSARAIDEFIHARIEDFRIISLDPTLYESSPQEVSAHLQVLVKRVPTYAAFFIADRSGQIRASSEPTTSNRNLLELMPDIRFQFERIFKTKTDDVVATDATVISPHASPDYRPVMTGLNLKVLGGIGAGKGERVLVGVVYLPVVENLVHDLDRRTVGSEHAYLLNDRGQVLATEDPSLKFPELFPDFTNESFRHELESRQTGTYVYRHARGVVISGFARLSRRDSFGKSETWWLVSIARYNEVMGEIRRLFSYVLAAVIATGVLMILGAIAVSRIVTKPVLKLAQASRQIGSGQAAAIDINSKDEIGELASAFRTMTRGLAATQASLHAEIEERRQVIHALRESEEKYRTIIENTQDGYFEVNRSGELTFFNPSFSAILQRQPAELQKLADVRLMDEKNMQKVEEALRSVLETGSPIAAVDYEIKLANNTVRVVEVSLAIARDARQEIVGCRGVLRDITERKRAEEQLRATLKMQSDFVSFVSHQLRTPLAGIKWLLELAIDNNDMPSETRSFVEDGHRSAQRLAGLVNDLLDVARLERGTFQNELKRGDLAELTRSVVQEIQPLIQSKGHELIVSGLDTIPNVMMDAQLFRQVILNLVSNAIKYTPNGGTIEIRAQTQQAAVKWEIKDSGIGIPPAAQARLFEKFFRADNALTVETEGTGLGLYLVKLIVEKSGGNVWCESAEGSGSKFCFSLPLIKDVNHDKVEANSLGRR